MSKFLKNPTVVKVEHLVFVFLATFVVTLVFNAEHWFSAHGMNGWKAAVPALVAAAAMGAWQQVRAEIVAIVIGPGPAPAPDPSPAPAKARRKTTRG